MSALPLIAMFPDDYPKPLVEEELCPLTAETNDQPESRHLLLSEPISNVISGPPESVSSETLSRPTTSVLSLAWRNLREGWHVCIAFLAFFVEAFGKQSLKISVQYASIRFDITIAQVSQFLSGYRCIKTSFQAGYLFPIKAAVVFLLFALIVPFRARILHLEPSIADYVLARVSIYLLAAGSAIMGIAASLWVFLPGKSKYQQRSRWCCMLLTVLICLQASPSGRLALLSLL